MTTPSKRKATPPTEKSAEGEAVKPKSARGPLVELAAMAAQHDVLQALDHETLEVQFPDPYCASQGALTRSRGTLKDSLDWLRVLHPKKGPASHGDLGLAPSMLPLLIEWTRRLAVHIEALDGGTPVATADLEAVRAAAQRQYSAVRASVGTALGKNTEWKAQLDKHLDGEKHAELDDDAARLLRLADAIEAWRSGDDPRVKHALAGQRITADTVTACTAAADALEQARTGHTGKLGGSRDTPEVNLVEGRVLVLMGEVFDAVNRARAAKKTTLVLVPGAATKRVIQPNAKPRKKKP